MARTLLRSYIRCLRPMYGTYNTRQDQHGAVVSVAIRCSKGDDQFTVCMACMANSSLTLRPAQKKKT